MNEDFTRQKFEDYIGSGLERTITGEYRLRRVENDWQLWLEATEAANSESSADLAEARGQLEAADLQNNRFRDAIFAMMSRLAFLLDEDHFAELDSLAARAGVSFSEAPALTFDDVQVAMAVAQCAATNYTSAMGEAAEDYHKSFKFAHPLPAQWRWHEVWSRMQQAQQVKP